MPFNWRYVWALLKKHQGRVFDTGTNNVKKRYHKAFMYLTKRCEVTFRYGRKYWRTNKAVAQLSQMKTQTQAQTQSEAHLVSHFRPPPQYVLDALSTTGDQLNNQAYFTGSVSAGDTHVLSAWV